MKRLLFALILVITVARLAAQNWQWARKVAGGQTEYCDEVCTDAWGNAIITGGFVSSSLTVGSYTLTNSGGWDMFVSKYDSSGNVIWAKGAVSSGNDYGYGVAVDIDGNILVSGYFSSPTITFGSYTLTNAGLTDIFVVKYDTAGNVVWAKGIGGVGEENSYGVVVNTIGNVFITGYFRGASVSFGNTTLTNQGGNDIYIAMLDASGNHVWAKGIGNVADEEGHGITSDANGNTFITGYFRSSSITIGSFVLNNAGGDDYFIAKYDLSGTEVWAKSGGGSNNESSHDIASDVSGNVFVTGGYRSSSMTIGGYTLVNNGTQTDVFTVKYDVGGAVLWAKAHGTVNSDAGFSVNADLYGNAYISGYYSNAPITFGGFTLSNTGSIDFFVTKFDANGNVLWAKQTGGTGIDITNNIATGANGVVYAAGYFLSPSLNFNGTVLTNGSGMADIFLAKIADVTTKVDEIESFDLRVAPNPFSGSTVFFFTKLYENATFQLFDMTGKEVKNIQFSGKEFVLERQELANGVYFFRIINSTSATSGKLIVQ